MDLAHLELLLARARKTPHSAELAAEIRAARPGAGVSLPEWIKRLEMERARHEARGEYLALAALMECELGAPGVDADLAWELARELGRIYHEELLDDATALTWLEKARTLGDADGGIAREIAHLEQLRVSWEAIAERFGEESATATEGALQRSLLVRAASLVWQYGQRGRDVRVDTLFESAAKADPANTSALRSFLVTLRDREEWERVAEVAVRAARVSESDEEKAGFLAVAAHAYAQVPGADAARERVLDELGHVDPSDEDALAAHAARLTQEERWDDLAQLYERALRGRLPREAEHGVLLQVAMIHWRMRGDAQAAEPFFARLARHDPAHPVLRDFYRAAYYDTGRDPEKFLAVLADALRSLGTSPASVPIASELAIVTEATHGPGDRVVELWRAVERLDPGNETARASLRRIYRATEKWNALLDLLRAEVEALPADRVAERVRALEEMRVICRDELKLTAMVIATTRAIVELDPENEGAFLELGRLYEETGRLADLAALLKGRAAQERDAARRRQMLERLVALSRDRLGSVTLTTETMEALAELTPATPEALAELRETYERARDWRKLRRTLERIVEAAPSVSEGREARVALVKLLDDKLHLPDDAVGQARALLADFPSDTEVLALVEHVAFSHKQHALLAEALEASLLVTTDARARSHHLRRLASLYRDELKDSGRATMALERLVEEDRTNSRAFRLLADGYATKGAWDELERVCRARGDLEGLAEALGTAAERATAPDERVQLSLRSARVFADELGKAERAARHLERVLLVQPDHLEAAERLEPFYERTEQWSKLVQAKAARLKAIAASDAAARAKLAEELADISALRLTDAPRAYAWMLGAYEASPDGGRRLEKLERFARGADALAGFVEEVEARLDALPEPERGEVHARLAEVVAQDLADRGRAVTHLEAARALVGEPARLTARLAEHYRALGRFEDLRALLEAEAGRSSGDALRACLLELSIVLEERLRDPAAAAAVHERLLGLEPDDLDRLVALERLHRQTGDVGALEETLARRAGVEARVAPGQAADTRLRLARLRVEHGERVAEALDELELVLRASGGDERAVELAEQVRTRFPDHAARAESLLEQAYESRASHVNLRAVLERKLRSASAADEREHTESKLIELLSEQIGDVAAALGHVRAVVERRPTAREWWPRLESLAERAGDAGAAVEAFVAASKAKGLKAELREELVRRSVAFGARTQLPLERMVPLHVRLLELSPGDESAFLALRAFYADTGRFRELEALFEARLAIERNVTERERILLEAAFVYEEVLDDPAHAIEAYARVVSDTPRHPQARKALARLHRRAMNWEALVALLAEDAAVEQGEAKARTALEMGEVIRRRLHDAARALPHFEAALAADPSERRAKDALLAYFDDAALAPRAAAALRPHLASLGEWAAYASCLKVLIAASPDGGAEAELLADLVRVLEVELRDGPAAFPAARRWVEVDPGAVEAREALARLAVRPEQLRERAEALAAARERASQGRPHGEAAQDQAADGELAAVRSLLLEEAEVWDARLGDSARAEQAYRAALPLLAASSPARRDVLRALVRIAEARTERVRQEPRELAALLRELAASEPDARERRALLERLGALWSAHNAHEEALSAFEEAFALSPTDARLAEAVRASAVLAGHAEAERGALFALAEHAPDAAAREMAALAYAERARDGGPHVAEFVSLPAWLASFAKRNGETRAVLRAVASLAVDAGELETAYAALLRSCLLDASPPEAASLRLEAATLARERLADAARVWEALDDPSLDPSHGDAAHLTPALREALGALSLHVATSAAVPPDARRKAAERAEAAFERASEFQSWLEALEALAAVIPAEDAAEVASIRLRGAGLLLTALGDPEGAVRWLALAAASASDGQLEDVARLLERARTERRGGEEFTAVVATTESAMAERATDASLAARFWADAGAVWLGVGRTENARSCFERALARDPGCGAAEAALIDMARGAADPAALAALLEARLGRLTEARERVPSILELAELYERGLHDVDEARRAYDLLEQVGERRLRAQRIEKLLTEGERWGELAAFLTEEMERGAADPVETHHRLGVLARERFSDPAGALEHFRAVLSRKADHGPTAAVLTEMLEEPGYRAEVAELLEPVYVQRLDWRRVAAVIEARIAGESEPAERTRLLHRRAQILEEYLEDLDAAFAAYAELLRENPSDVVARDVLDRLGRVLSRELDLADVYADIVEGAAVLGPELLDLARAAAEVFAKHAERIEDAIRAFERILEFEPEDAQADSELERLFRETGRTAKLVDLLERRAQRAPSDDAARGILLERARTLRAAGPVSGQVVEAYLEVLDLRPDDTEALDAIEACLVALEDWAGLYEHLGRRLDLVLGTALEVDVRAQMAQVLDGRLGRTSEAIEWLEATLAAHPAEPRILGMLEGMIHREAHQREVAEALERVYRGAGEWKKLIAVLEAHVLLLADGADRAPLLAEVAELHREHSGDARLELDALVRLLEDSVDRATVLGRVRELATATSQWDSLARTLERAAELEGDGPEREAMLRELGALHRAQRHDLRSAAETYERVAAIAKEDLTVLETLEALYTELRRFELVEEVLGRQLSLVGAGEQSAIREEKRGRLLAGPLRDEAAAAMAYERALVHDPLRASVLEPLDALYARARDHEKRQEVLRRRAEVARGDDRAALLRERARVLAKELSRPADAVACLEEALSVSESDLAALRMLVSVHATLEQHAELVEALERTAKEEFEPDVRADLLVRAARVLEERLDDAEGATERYGRALEEFDPHPEAVDALTRLAQSERTRATASLLVLPRLEAMRRHDDLIAVLRGLADAEPEPTIAGPLHRRMGAVHELERGDPKAAFQAYMRAVRLVTSDRTSAEAMSRVAAMVGEWGALADGFEEFASLAEAPPERAYFAFEAARVSERELGDVARAVRLLGLAEATGVDADQALGELDRLLELQGDMPALRGVLEKRLVRAESAEARALFRVRLGALERALGNLPRAVEHYAAALALEPTLLAALAALEELLDVAEVTPAVRAALDAAYEASANHAARARIALRMAAKQGDRRVRAEELAVAAAHWDRGSHAEEAMDALRAAWVHEPESHVRAEAFEAAVLALGSLAAFENAAADALGVLTDGGPTEEPVRNCARLVAARWARQHLGRGELALSLARDALASDPSLVEAHLLAADLLREAARPADEIAALRSWEAVLEDDGERLEVVRRRAFVAVVLAADPAEARAAHEAILSIEPTDVTTLDALLAELEVEGAWNDAVPRFEQRLVLAEHESPATRVGLRHRQMAALLAATRPDEPTRLAEASEAGEAILAESPQDRRALEGLAEVYRRRGRFEDVLHSLERLRAIADASELGALDVQRAQVLRSELGRLGDARAVLDAAREAAPDDQAVLEELGHVLIAQGEREAALALLESRIVQARIRDDVALEIRLLEQIGEVARSLESFERARVAYERVLAVDPQHLGAAHALVALAREGVVALDVRAALARVVRAEQGEARVRAALELAALAEAEGDPRQALDMLLLALEVAPANGDVIARVDALLAHHADPEVHLRVQTLRAERAEEPAAAFGLWLDVARRALEGLGDPARALGALERARAIDGANREMLWLLADVYVALGRAADAAQVCQAVVDGFGGKRSKELGAAYHRLGVAQASAGDAEAALRAFEAASRFDLTSVPVLRDLGRLAYERGDLDRAQKALRALLLQKLDERSLIRKADVYFLLGDIAAKQGDSLKAVSMLKKALLEDKAHAEAAALLRTLGAG